MATVHRGDNDIIIIIIIIIIIRGPKILRYKDITAQIRLCGT